MAGDVEPDRAIVVDRRGAGVHARDYTATLALINESSGDYVRMRVEHASLSEYSAELLRLVSAERSELRRTIVALENALAAKTKAVDELRSLNAALDQRCQRSERDLAEVGQRYQHLETFCEEIIVAIQPLLNVEANPMLSEATLMPLLQSIESGN